MTRVVLIGSGNIARALGPAVDALDGYSVVQVISPTAGHAEALASALASATSATEVEELDPSADMALIAVSDDSIEEVASRLPRDFVGVTAHVSGSKGLEALEGAPGPTAAIYPFQTFTAGRPVDFSVVPFFVEGNDSAAELASHLSPKVYRADSAVRRRLHLAGVLACNFTNRLLALAVGQLEAADLPLDVLRPIVEETVAKAFALGPVAAQTGPARRGDTTVNAAHEAMLPEDEALIYRLLTESIQSAYRTDKP